jgi:polyisoprenoid-binding protein YceI
VSIAPGTYRLGPEDGTLVVRTGRTGTVAKAGHDLLIHVTAWNGMLEVGDETLVTLDANATSLRVREGTGGMIALDDGDRENIRQTIDDEVLKRQDISFRSTRVEAAGDELHVEGELTLRGATRPLAFDLSVAEGRLTGAAVVKQTAWGVRPYTALFGALKVADDVRVEIDAALPQSR